jgi:hypothetical protein
MLDFNESWIFSKDFPITLTYQVNENPSRDSWVVPCGQAGMAKLKVVFRNFAKAPKKCHNQFHFGYSTILLVRYLKLSNITVYYVFVK